jgi:hypothetical protein
MKVIGNVQLSNDAINRLANRMKFPTKETPTHVTAHGEEYAVGQTIQSDLEVAEDLVVNLTIQAIRTKDGEPALVATVHPLFKEGYCPFCGTPDPGWECPTCGAT